MFIVAIRANGTTEGLLRTYDADWGRKSICTEAFLSMRNGQPADRMWANVTARPCLQRGLTRALQLANMKQKVMPSTQTRNEAIRWLHRNGGDNAVDLLMG